PASSLQPTTYVVAGQLPIHPPEGRAKARRKMGIYSHAPRSRRPTHSARRGADGRCRYPHTAPHGTSRPPDTTRPFGAERTQGEERWLATPPAFSPVSAPGTMACTTE